MKCSKGGGGDFQGGGGFTEMKPVTAGGKAYCVR